MEALKEAHPLALRRILYGMVVFFSCCCFPLRWEKSLLAIAVILLTVVLYREIGQGLAWLYGSHQARRIYPKLLVSTFIGLVCRYFLEYGEISNVYNFTPLYVLTYLLIVPFYTLAVYQYQVWYLSQSESRE